MTTTEAAWDELPGPVTTIGAWRAGVLFEPMGGEAPGGDRFALSSASSRSLAFYVADATGHGRKGAEFWQDFDAFFREQWQRFASNPTEHTLVEFASALNDTLHERGRDENHDSLSSSSSSHLAASQLCLAAGWLADDGTLVYASFGLGVHVVPVTAEGLRWVPGEAAFGFRLGWVPSSAWPGYEAALVIKRIPGVRRVWLASDAFFGNDHWDPQAAFERVRELGEKIMDVTIEGALFHVRRLPHSGDDATFVIVEPAASRG